MKFVYPFIISTSLTHPYERTVSKLQLEKAFIKILLFTISICGATLGGEFTLQLAFLH